MDIPFFLLPLALASVTVVGLAVLVTIFARNRGRAVEVVSDEPEPPLEVTDNPYQPSRLYVTVKRHSRQYSSGELKLVVGGSIFVGLTFAAIILFAWLVGG